MDIDIVLPKPHAMQRAILSSKASRVVVCSGRRSGKTELVASLKSVPHFLRGGRVLYGAPVASQTDVFWETVNKRLYPLIKGGYIYRNKTERYLEWSTGRDGRIKAKTAYDADTWRGDWGDLLVYDEFAFMKPDAWEVVGMPMLLDTGGEAWFISTPKRKNHFHSLFMRGLEGEDGRWASFKFSSFDNPYLDRGTLQELIEDMTEANYQQEIMAEFLENEGAVFRKVAEAHTLEPTEVGDHFFHFTVCGIDWGKRNDYTALSVVCVDCKQELELTRFNKIDYIYQRERLIDTMRRYNVKAGIAELNAMGEPNLELLQADSLPIVGFWTTGSSKPPLIENLVRVVEKQEYQFTKSLIGQAEMEAYEVKINPQTNRPSYSAPDGVNDDTVIARALAIWLAQRYVPASL